MENHDSHSEFASYDGEGLFFFEGMDDTPATVTNSEISDLESDAEGNFLK